MHHSLLTRIEDEHSNICWTSKLKVIIYLQELDKFEKALKDEEFRKLLVQYAEEISDPENKKVRFNSVSQE